MKRSKIILLLLTCFIACKKEIVPVLPGDTPAIGLNFFPASDVTIAYAKDRQLTAIYVDHYNPVLPRGNGSGTPVFSYNTNGMVSESPDIHGSVFSFLRYNAGVHRLMFTDTANAVVLDTTINFGANSNTSVYFADALTAVNSPPVYKAVAVEEKRSEVPTGMVGVRFVHLSADAGTLICNRIKPDGSLVNALPADLHFGEASAYQYFSADDVTKSLIRFSLDNPNNGASVFTGVPYNPGMSYVVVISGFWDEQQRQINHKSITINRNLRAIIRRSY